MSELPKSETFDEYYYNHYCGIPYERSEHWLNFFDKIAKQIIETINPKAVLDAGCAWGFLVEALRNRGVEAYGIDISEFAISNVVDTLKPYCSVGSISEPFDRPYDLIVSIEVLEHMTPEEALKAIENFCAHSERVLFSSTPFDYKEVTHVNVRLPEYWAKNFSQHGFYRDLDYDASFITAWATLYTKRQLTPDRLVYEYERSHWPLVKEKFDLRQHIAESQSYIEKMEKLRDAAVLEAQHYQNLMAVSESITVSKEAEIEALKHTIATNESIATSKEAEIEALRNTIATNESIATSKEAETEALKHTIDRHEARLQEINVHWKALVNSSTWKALNKLGKFKDFPDLST